LGDEDRVDAVLGGRDAAVFPRTVSRHASCSASSGSFFRMAQRVTSPSVTLRNEASRDSSRRGGDLPVRLVHVDAAASALPFAYEPGARVMPRGSLPAVEASWTEGFGIGDLPGGKPGKHDDYAEIEALLPGGQDNRVQLRLAAAKG
jgi:hypothetical protein